MAKLARLEQRLLGKKLIEAEIENLVEEGIEAEMQLSLHILSARGVQISIHSKVQRQIKFMLDGQVFESRSSACEGLSQTVSWNETHLVPVRSYESSLKLVYLEPETSPKPLGGVVIKVSGLMDQKRHDGWYDLGCGEIRLALRFLHNPTLLLKSYLSSLNKSIRSSESLLSRSTYLTQEHRLEHLYCKLKPFLLKSLLAEAKILKLYMDNSAKRLQRAFRPRLNLNEELREVDSKEEDLDVDLESFLRKIDSEINVKESSEKFSPGFKTEDSVFFNIENDPPPYIEAVEKVCKRRIAIKKY